MIEGLISVVLPIYNVRNYLERCMSSVANQTYHNIEIIMVDDGSTDGCFDICEEWKKKDKRVKVIHKKNAGLGLARNSGLDIAEGEYVMFFDSDDYVDESIVEKCYLSAKKNCSEIVFFGHSIVNSIGKVKKEIVPSSQKYFYYNSEVVDIVLPDLLRQNNSNRFIRNLWMSAWSCFFSMQYIEKTNWRFVSEREIISEDVFSILQLFSKEIRISIIPESLYFYCENAASLTHVYREDRLEKNNVFYRRTVEQAKKLHFGEDIIDSIKYPYLGNIIGMIKVLVNSKQNYSDKLAKLRDIICNQTLEEVINNINYNNEKLSRKVLFWSIKGKHNFVTYWLIRIKSIV